MSTDCLMCQLAKAKQVNALLKVPKEVPNPELAKAIAEGKPVSGKREVQDYNRQTGRYNTRLVYWAIPKTVPNPNLDLDCFDARMQNPETCQLHIDLANARLRNVIVKRDEAMAKAMVQDAKAVERISREIGKPQVVTMRVAYAG